MGRFWFLAMLAAGAAACGSSDPDGSGPTDDGTGTDYGSATDDGSEASEDDGDGDATADDATGADGSATGAASDDGGTETGGAVECPVAGDLGAGEHAEMLTHDGADRAFNVVVPASYDPASATPLVLNMHGATSNAWQQALFSNMNPTAEAEGFVVVYPDGIGGTFNGGTCCGDMTIDDVGFLTAIVDHLATRLCIDTDRVYATGMSNGGYMSHRVACEASSVFAAIAPVAGAMGIPDCMPPRPMPVIGYHGVQDGLVSYSSGQAAIAEWVGLNGCTGDPDRTDHGTTGSYCETWSNCDDGVEVALCTLDPMGHCWPGGSELLCLPGIGPFNADIDANADLWTFMSRFTLG